MTHYVSTMPLRRSLPAFVLAAILFAYIVYPVVAMLGQSLTLSVDDYRAEAMGWDPRHQPFAAPLRRLAAERGAREGILRTVALAAATVLAGSLWGGGLALLWQRREFPLRRIFAALGYAPILLPPLVGALAFFRLVGDGGLLWRWLGSPYGAPLISGFAQVLLVHAYSFGIYAYAYVSAALEDVDLSYEEAARNLGASGYRVFAAAVWPPVRAPLLASAFLTFMAAAASFSAPYILDNAGRYLTVDILTADDIGMQRALSVVLALIALSALPAFLYLDRRGRSGADTAFGVKGAARRQLPPSRVPAFRVALSCAAALILLAPPMMIVVSALAPEQRGLQAAALTGLDGDDWWSLGRSGAYASAAALIDIALAVAIALALRRAALSAGALVEFAVMLALALPGSALAIALLTAFNGPSPLAFGQSLGQTSAILILAYAIRNLPLAVRPVNAAFAGLGAALENAAAGLGAARFAVLWRVTLPLIFPSVLAAALICFITGLGEYVASLLLTGGRNQPVSVRIDYLIHQTRWAAAHALALWLMIASAVVIVGARLLRRR